MNETTDKLIRGLAEKLGTTTQHLWSVLLKQAPISSTSDTILILGYLAILIFLYKIVREKTKEEGDWNDGCGSSALPWMIWVGFLIGFLIIVVTSFSTIIAGFVNPEFWALKQLIG